MPPKVRFEEAKTAQTSNGKSSNVLKTVLKKRLRFSRATTAQSPAAAQAQQAVLSTWELVELILEYVDDVRDLLFFQRVSTTWRDVIRGSVRQQERLFLRPATPTDKEKGAWRGSGEGMGTGTVELNPLLTRVFPHFFQYVTSEPQPPRPLETFPLWARWHSQLLLLEEEAEYEGVSSRNGRRISSGGDKSNRRKKKEKNQAAAAMARRGASWRAMLVSQPPPDRLKYGSVVVARSSSGHDRHERNDPNPNPVLRMGALYDLAYYAQWRTGVFKVVWQLYDQPFDDEGHLMLPRERWDHRKSELYRDICTNTLLSRDFLDVCVWENSWVRERAASSKEKAGVGIVRSGGDRVPDDKEAPELPAPHPCQYVGASKPTCTVMENHSECGCWSLSHRFRRRERLVYKASKICNRKERCAQYRCEEYDQVAVTEPLTRPGTSFADVESHAQKGRYKSVSAE